MRNKCLSYEGAIILFLCCSPNWHTYIARHGGEAHANSGQPRGHRRWDPQDKGVAGLGGPQLPSVCSKRRSGGQAATWILHHSEAPQEPRPSLRLVGVSVRLAGPPLSLSGEGCRGGFGMERGNRDALRGA